MIKKILLLLIFFVLTLISPPHTQAATTITTDTAGGVEYATLQGFESIFKNTLKIIVPIAGIGLFITLLIGGFQYITSGGDPKQAQKAQSIITSAIIGVVTLFGLWFVFRLLTDFTEIDLFWFEIPGP